MAQMKKQIYSIALTIVLFGLISCIDKSLCYFHFESISNTDNWTETDSLTFKMNFLEQRNLVSAQDKPLIWKLEAITSRDFRYDIIRVEVTRVCDSICRVDTINMKIITDKLGTPIRHWGSQRYISSNSDFLDWKADTIRKVLVRPLIISSYPDSIRLSNDSIDNVRKHYIGITDIGLSVQRQSSKR